MAKKKISPWDDAPDAFVPAATPAQQARELTGRRRRIIAVGTIAAAAISSVTMLAWLTDPARELDKTPSSLSINDSSGKAAAYSAMYDWFASPASPVPGGSIVSWDGFTAIAGGDSGTEGLRAADPGELHYFTIAAPSERRTLFYTATVFVYTDPALGYRVAASPSLLPRLIPSDSGWSTAVWPGYTTTAENTTLRSAVRSWANAFTSTPEELRIYVGDPDPAHNYLPLAGARVVETSIQALATRSEDSGRSNTTMLARVEIIYTWFDGDDATVKTSYDVLISGATTAAPRIVAWGPAGTGPTLEPYINAVLTRVESTPTPSDVTPPPAEPDADAVEGDGDGEA